MMEFKTERGLKLKFGEFSDDWIEVTPNVQIEELSDGDTLIIIKGVFRVQGKSPWTMQLTRLV